MATEVFNTEQFPDKLGDHDGAAKWYMQEKRVFITADTDTVPNSYGWDYAFSDELDCINWKKMGFESPF